VNGKISFDPKKLGFGVELKRELLAPFKSEHEFGRTNRKPNVACGKQVVVIAS
jgi:hypothetical protein